jgi:LPXTG-site transpeptidase (sortase) family protein
MQILSQSAEARPISPEGTPEKKHIVWRVIKGILPLFIIALLVYAVYNFPALVNQAKFLLHPPTHGKTNAYFPSNIPGGRGNQTAQSVQYCGTHPVPYDGIQPKAICDNYIYIPNIHVAAPIVWPKSTDEPTINAELLNGVVHYPGTAEPGQKGNVFLTGHSSFYWWVNTDYRTVFTLIPRLIPGDQIVVYNKGIRYEYRITQAFEVSPNQTEVLNPTPDPVITLSTCVPIGTSYRRHIVRAVQVSPDPSTAHESGGSGPSAGHLPGVR